MSAQLSLLELTPEEHPVLPSWRDDRRGFPLALAVSSVFASSSIAPRKLFKSFAPVASHQSVNIYFRGEELRENIDKPLWMLLVHLGRGQRFVDRQPIVVRSHAAELLRRLDWPCTKFYYQALDEALQRMVGAQIKVKFNTPMGRRQSYLLMPMIAQLEHEAPSEACAYSRYVIHINPVLANLFAHGYIEVDAHQASALTGTLSSKVLDAIRSTNEDVFTTHLSDLLQFTGSSNKSLPSFKQGVKRALYELVDKKLIANYKFERNLLQVLAQPEQSFLGAIQNTTFKVHQPTDMQEEAMS